MLDLVLPTTCASCGEGRGPLCGRCEQGLEPAPVLAVPTGLDGLGVVWAYDGVARDLVAGLKY
ncbi:hypothetical protein B7486_79355, partial [cyanobacterium TDX16]